MTPEHLNALPLDHALHWYRLERVLGQGGFGITYLARDTNLDQLVAIKEYLPVDFAVRAPDKTVQPRSQNQIEGYAWGLERFIREAQTLVKFDHPNIVRVYSVFEQNNTAYMVMRYEQGENLQSLLDRGQRLDERALLAIVLPILDGLERIHDAGFIHRDIKPDNIYIREDGSPVLLDFGSARRILGKTHTLTVLMSPGYAPFEQYHSTDEQGPWTDIYSLGATLYRAVAGEAPIDALARSKGVLGSTKDLLVPATQIGRGRYSQPFLEAIDHALAFNERDRPQTIASWQAELQGERVVATPRKRTRRALPPRAAVATAGLVLLSLLGVFIWQQIRPPRAPVPIAPKEETAAAERLVRLEEGLTVLTRQLEEQRRAEVSLAKRQQALREERKRLEERRQAAETAPSEEQQVKKERLATLEKRLDDDQKQLEKTQRRLEEQRRKTEEERQRQAAAVRQREEKIAQLLTGAEAALAAGRLSTLVGDNALENFQQVLALAPDNEEAKRGIHRVVERYITFADQALKRHQFDKAKGYLDKAAVIDPGSQEIAHARTELATERAAFDQKALTTTSTPVAQTKARLGIFPTAGNFGQGNNGTQEGQSADILRAMIGKESAFELTYSYYHSELKAPSIKSQGSVWAYHGNDKEPNILAIGKLARERNIDGVLLARGDTPDGYGFLDGEHPQNPVTLYMLDTKTGQVYRRQGTFADMNRMAEQVLSEFLKNRKSKLSTSKSPTAY